VGFSIISIAPAIQMWVAIKEGSKQMPKIFNYMYILYMIYA